MEQRHDWAKMVFTLELFKYVLFTLIPEVIKHTEAQDEEQVRDHYDREYLCPPRHFATLPLPFNATAHVNDTTSTACNRMFDVSGLLVALASISFNSFYVHDRSLAHDA